MQVATLTAGQDDGKPANKNILPLDYKGEEERGMSELKLSAGVELAFLGTGSALPSKYRKEFVLHIF